MACPNFRICSENDTRYCGVCYICDTSQYGYNDKKNTLQQDLYPDIYSHPTSPSEYDRRRLDKNTRNKLLEQLEKNRLGTALLNIKETHSKCPICLENKELFVKHPTCNRHYICNICFKKSFLDGWKEDNSLVQSDYYDRRVAAAISNNFKDRLCPICKETKLTI